MDQNEQKQPVEGQKTPNPITFHFLGMAAFQAYSESKRGTTYDNKPIPPWENLSKEVQDAWIASAKVVYQIVKDLSQPAL